MTSTSGSNSPGTKTPLLTISVVLSLVVIVAVVALPLLNLVALGDLLIPGAVVGIIAAVLGAIGHGRSHIILGIIAAIFPLIWFLLAVKLFGFV